MTATSYHLCQNLEGALARWNSREWSKVVTNKDGDFLKPLEVKKKFEALVAKGVKVIPFGDCDNFDDQTGCRGHIEKGCRGQKEEKK